MYLLMLLENSGSSYDSETLLCKTSVHMQTEGRMYIICLITRRPIYIKGLFGYPKLNFSHLNFRPRDPNMWTKSELNFSFYPN